MTPFFFGPPARRLFACHHAPAGSAVAAVVLIAPWGQEALRAHRLLRVLAERLARAGAAVLRFDPYGSGDAAGDDGELDLPGWQADLLAAHAELQAHSGPLPTTWAGMGLGATVAALAAATPPERLARLVLYGPVTQGAAYLATLRQRHVQRLDQVLALPPVPRASDEAAQQPQSHQDQALGFGLGQALRAQLAALDGWPTPTQPTVWLDVALPYSRAPVAGPRVEPADEAVDWMLDTPDNGTLIPARLSAQLMRHLAPVP